MGNAYKSEIYLLIIERGWSCIPTLSERSKVRIELAQVESDYAAIDERPLAWENRGVVIRAHISGRVTQVRGWTGPKCCHSKNFQCGTPRSEPTDIRS